MLKKAPSDWLTDPNAFSIEDHNKITNAFGEAFAADKANKVIEPKPPAPAEDPEALKRMLLSKDPGVSSMITD